MPTAFAPPIRIETPRVILRPWRADDAAALQDVVFHNLGHLAPWMPWATTEGHADVEVVAARLQRFADAFTIGRDWPYVMETRADGTFLGAVGLHPHIEPDALEIGYWIRADYSGQGYVTESVAALVEAAFASDEIARIQIRCAPANLASAAIPRRLGFRHVTTLIGNAPSDTMVWEVTRDG